MSVELEVRCEQHGKDLTVYVSRSGVLEVTPCEKCIEEANEEGKVKGYEDGYDTGYAAGKEDS